jgi:hypothetical protein
MILDTEEIDIESELSLAMEEIQQNESDLKQFLEVAKFLFDQH